VKGVFPNKEGKNKWVQDLNLSQESLASYAIGEHTALLTWLEFPDCNTQPKSG
jgi:hypothetical protein